MAQNYNVLESISKNGTINGRWLKFAGLKGLQYFDLHNGHFYSDKKCADAQFLELLNSFEKIPKCNARESNVHFHPVPSRASVEIATISWACKLKAIRWCFSKETNSQLMTAVLSAWPRNLPIPSTRIEFLLAGTVEKYRRMAKENNKYIRNFLACFGEKVFLRFREAILQPHPFWTDPVNPVVSPINLTCPMPCSSSSRKEGDHILAELKRVIGIGETIFKRAKKVKDTRWLLQCTNMIVIYRALLDKNLKNVSSDSDDERTIRIARKHKLFRPSRLEKWLQFKQAEMEMEKKLNSINNVTLAHFSSDGKLRYGGWEEKQSVLVLHIPPLNALTKEAVNKMKIYVKDYTEKCKMESEDEAETTDEENEESKNLPWHTDEQKKKQILDELNELANYCERNKPNQDYPTYMDLYCFVSFTTRDKVFKIWYSLYQNGHLTKKFSQLPGPPTGLCLYYIDAGVSCELLSIGVKWNYDVRDFYPCKYLIQYRSKNSTSTPWMNKKTEKTKITLPLEPGTVLELRVATITCCGLSEFSEVIDTKSIVIDRLDPGENRADPEEISVNQEEICVEPEEVGADQEKIDASEEIREAQKRSSVDDVINEVETVQTMPIMPLPKRQKLILLPPTDLKVTKFEENKATLTWTPSVGKNTSFFYRIKCWLDEEENLAEEFDVQSSEVGCFINDLEPATTYSFQMIAISDDGHLRSIPSEIVTLTTLAELRFAEILVKQCTKIKDNNGLNIYSVPLTKSIEMSTESVQTVERYVFEAGQENWSTQPKTVMLFGDVDSNKTSLINAMINYIFNVEFQDAFRFQLIDEQEQAANIRIYEILHSEGFNIPYSLTIVDTPSYGDTCDSDQKVTEMIRKFIEDTNEIQELDIIGFVAPAKQPSQSPRQKKFMESILSIFGKDFQDKIHFLSTCPDQIEEPPNFSSITLAKIPSPTEPRNPLCYKFNHSNFYTSNCDLPEQNNRLQWDMGVKHFQVFLSSLTVLESKTLILTRQVLEERKRLSTLKEEFISLNKTGILKMIEMAKNEKIIEEIQDEIDGDSEFTFEVDAAQAVEIPAGYLVTNCIKCSVTCYEPCRIKDEIDGSVPADFCLICPGKCSWNTHSNQPFKWETVREKSIIPLKVEQEINDDEMQKKKTAYDAIKSLEKEIEDNEIATINQRKLIAQCIVQLEAIALQDIDPLSELR